MRQNFKYGFWDEPEEVQKVFENIKWDEWDLMRFEKWVSHLKTTIIREATADENY